MAENFTSWSPGETDTGGYLTITSAKIDAVSMPRNVTSYHVDDKTAGHFSGDFQFDYELYVSNMSASNSRFFAPSICNNLGDLGSVADSLIELFTNTTLIPTIADIDNLGNTDAYTNGTSISQSTLYYNTFSRTTNELDLDIYTNAARTTLNQNVSMTIVNTSTNFRYLYGLSSSSDAISATATGYVQNLDINEGATENSIVATFDSVLKTLDQVKTTSMDAALQKVDQTIASTLDSVLQGLMSITTSFDAHLTGGGEASISSTLDAILQTAQNLTATLDSVLQKGDNSIVTQFDVALKKAYDIASTLDTVVAQSTSISSTLSSVLKKTGIQIVTTFDAVLSTPGGVWIPDSGETSGWTPEGGGSDTWTPESGGSDTWTPDAEI